METKKVLTELIEYFGAGAVMKGNLEYTLYAILAITVINRLYGYFMRNSPLTESGERKNDDGNSSPYSKTFRK
jgi:hypothetical protein